MALILVLDELTAAFPEPAVAAVASAVQRRLQEAAQAKVSKLSSGTQSGSVVQGSGVSQWTVLVKQVHGPNL